MYKKFFYFLIIVLSCLNLKSMGAEEGLPEGLPRVGVPRTILSASPLELEEVKKFCQDCAQQYPGKVVFSDLKSFTIFSVIDSQARRLSEGPVSDALSRFISKSISGMQDSLFCAAREITSSNRTIALIGLPSGLTISHNPLLPTLSKMTGILTYCLTKVHRENCFEEAGFVGRYDSGEYDWNFHYIRTAFGYLPVLSERIGAYQPIRAGYIIDHDRLRIKSNTYEKDSLVIAVGNDQNIICQSGILLGVTAKADGFSDPYTFFASFYQFSGANSATPFERLESHEKPLFYTDPTRMLATLSIADDYSKIMPFLSWYLESIKKGTINSRIEIDSERRGVPMVGKLYYPTFLPLPLNQRELIEFADYVREVLDSEDPDERAQALNFVRLIEDADEGEEVSIEGAKALMDQITPGGLSERLLEPVAEPESKETTAVAVVRDLVSSTEPLAVDGASIAERRAENARRRAERSSAGGGGVGAAIGASAGAGAGSGPVTHTVDSTVEENLGRVKTWKNALSFLNGLGFKRKSQKGSHVAFEGVDGTTLHVAAPHTDKAETHFPSRFAKKIRTMLTGRK